MSVPFITRAPTAAEFIRLRLAMSTFRDGSGMLMQRDGNTLPGWRDFERLIAAILGGHAPEAKDVFDVIVSSTVNPTLDFGISVKSKCLARRSAIGDLEGTGRVYMELSNSPAKFWAALNERDLTENDFRDQRQANVFGQTVLETVEGWHRDSAAQYAAANPGRTLSLDQSIHLVVSYDKPRPGDSPDYQLHSFDLPFPDGIVWTYRSARSLMGMDPDYPDEVLIDWYPLSGGQLKYYPRARNSRYSTESFTLEWPRCQTVLEKAARYWPADWVAAGGEFDVSRKAIGDELRSLGELVDDDDAKVALRDSAQLIDPR